MCLFGKFYCLLWAWARSMNMNKIGESYWICLTYCWTGFDVLNCCNWGFFSKQKWDQTSHRASFPFDIFPRCHATDISAGKRRKVHLNLYVKTISKIVSRYLFQSHLLKIFALRITTIWLIYYVKDFDWCQLGILFRTRTGQEKTDFFYLGHRFLEAILG